MAIKFVWWTFLGPRLFRIFKTENQLGRDYVPNFMESRPDWVVSTLNTAYSLTYWTAPVLGVFLYRRGYFTYEGGMGIMRVALTIAFVYFAALIFRGLGRLANPDYKKFIGALLEARKNSSASAKNQLNGYDFECWARPVDFKYDEGSKGDKKSHKPVTQTRRSQAVENASLPCKILSYLAIHSFGARMVYPGSTSIMNYLVGNMLQAGRAVLVEEKKGQRAVIETQEKNRIDTMFVDKRGQSTNGNTLVITAEGNAGFYEMGCSGTPLELNYSILGWNHPGFGGSTGQPYPDQELNAVDAVMQYAIHKLGFEPQNIALFAWSIGGYTAALLAKSYPDIKFVVLDATFDDIVPLAVSKMPQSWSNLVALALRSYMNLNVVENLVDYQGPVLLIRRSRDEIICTDTPPDRQPVIASNRINPLVIKLLQHRYPTIVDGSTIPVIQEYLAKETPRQRAMLNEKRVDYQECNNFFAEKAESGSVHFPWSIDMSQHMVLKTKLALFLVSVHMENFESTHCTPLPGDLFHKPWVPNARL